MGGPGGPSSLNLPGTGGGRDNASAFGGESETSFSMSRRSSRVLTADQTSIRMPSPVAGGTFGQGEQPPNFSVISDRQGGGGTLHTTLSGGAGEGRRPPPERPLAEQPSEADVLTALEAPSTYIPTAHGAGHPALVWTGTDGRNVSSSVCGSVSVGRQDPCSTHSAGNEGGHAGSRCGVPCISGEAAGRGQTRNSGGGAEWESVRFWWGLPDAPDCSSKARDGKEDDRFQVYKASGARKRVHTRGHAGDSGESGERGNGNEVAGGPVESGAVGDAFS
eukprot:Cvel_4202.t2-p1 / transcript=Cvel_4202.t2 / gene=Cvel_4202 / organism=Chromera_velia_CCMP2878 / gene_product=hypothetical protein / transcript_product=hypothetical protein / location=Cvel_scaffold181:63901-65572(-) / protein_length=276 / sequence_SO=supercontig / SO=protein_coding / is_pseudo=false